MTLFVDSSMYYAAVDRGDRSHGRAAAILRSGEPLATSDHIVVETWLALRGRLGKAIADRWWGAIRTIARVEMLTEGDLVQAWDIGERFADQDFSIVDRSSFAVMLRLGLTRVATLDDDFAVFRYGQRRDRRSTSCADRARVSPPAGTPEGRCAGSPSRHRSRCPG